MDTAGRSLYGHGGDQNNRCDDADQKKSSGDRLHGLVFLPVWLFKQDNNLEASRGKKIQRDGTRVDVTYGMRTCVQHTSLRDARGPDCPGLSVRVRR